MSIFKYCIEFYPGRRLYIQDCKPQNAFCTSATRYSFSSDHFCMETTDNLWHEFDVAGCNFIYIYIMLLVEKWFRSILSSRCQRPVISSSGRFKNLGCRTFPLSLSRFRVLTPLQIFMDLHDRFLVPLSMGGWLFPLLLFSLQFSYRSWWLSTGYQFPGFITEGTCLKKFNTIFSHRL